MRWINADRCAVCTATRRIPSRSSRGSANLADILRTSDGSGPFPPGPQILQRLHRFGLTCQSVLNQNQSMDMGLPTGAPPSPRRQLITHTHPSCPVLLRVDVVGSVLSFGFCLWGKANQETFSCISVLQGANEWVGTEPSCRREACFLHDHAASLTWAACSPPYADLPLTDPSDSVAEGNARSYCLGFLFLAFLPHLRITSMTPKLQIPAPRNERQRLGQPPPAHAAPPCAAVNGGLTCTRTQ